MLPLFWDHSGAALQVDREVSTAQETFFLDRPTLSVLQVQNLNELLVKKRQKWTKVSIGYWQSRPLLKQTRSNRDYLPIYRGAFPQSFFYFNCLFENAMASRLLLHENGVRRPSVLFDQRRKFKLHTESDEDLNERSKKSINFEVMWIGERWHIPEDHWWMISFVRGQGIDFSETPCIRKLSK